ncbi:iron complex outermembrane recepter protein [Chryseobacterium wanjuense]|uniref:Iron complex outermembrane recepter protein n=1 Tax=Chryseobacterium wanjuense TaxID=356305 RepID=A0A1I0RQG3_9FLAO|nr:TonB-dependent receptor [Chryseobacterium wanjuense]SEW43507.1 iron complex outermembrane recepter protein [Chryseobacterium wanjuense]
MKKTILLAAFISFSNAFSQENDSIRDIQEVKIQSEAGRLQAVNFHNVDPAKSSKNVGQEPSFLLSELVPSVTAYSDTGGNNGYSYYRIRGIDQTRINVSIDGAPMNEPEDQGSYFSNYPDIFNSFDKIQIQKGVGLSKNGTASYGGSIQLFSPDLKEKNLEFGANYGSYNSLRVYGKYTSGIKNDMGIHVRLSEIYSDGYKYNSSNHGQSAFISGGIFKDKSIWKFNALMGNQRNQLAWLGVTQEQIEKDPRTNGNRDEKDQFFQTFLQVFNQTKLGESSSLQSSIHYTYLNGNYDFNWNNFIGLPENGEMYNYAFTSKFLGFYTNFQNKFKNGKVTAGINGNLYHRNHKGSELSLGELYRNTGYKNDVSAFAEVELKAGKWIFSGDIQYRFADFRYKGDLSMDQLEWNFLNPKVGVNYLINNHSNVFFSLGRVGREPTRNDIFMGNDNLMPDENNQLTLGTTMPEYVTDYEIGYRFNKEKIKLELNLFYMDFKDEIVLNGNFGPNGLALTNKVDKSYRLGAELSFNYQINEHWSLKNNSSFVYSKIKEDNISFSPVLTPKIIVNQEVNYKINNFKINISSRFQDSSYMDFSNSAKLPSYIIFNSGILYDWKQWQIGFFVNNITNKRYYNYGYTETDGAGKYFIQMPRNYMASLKFKVF